jgi:predicted nucleic acid-binding protein
MSGGSAFFDTNILLYMYGGDAQKRTTATDLFRKHAQAGRVLVSTQVVQEFYAAGARKLGISRPELRAATEALLDLPLITVTAPLIVAAIENESRYGISFWDALIVAAAESGRAAILYTEDLNDGQRYGGAIACNPFRRP